MTRTKSVPVRGFHSSGKWDEPLDVWAGNVDRMQAIPDMSWGVHTEVTRDRVEAAFRRNPWQYFRADGEPAEQIVLSWDPDTWELVRSRTFVLTGIRVRTAKGHLQPPTHAAEVRLRHYGTGRCMWLSGGHWPLRNTPLRAKAWQQSAQNLAKHSRKVQAAFPDDAVAHSADLNESVRPGAEGGVQRARVLRVARNARLEQTWDLDHLPAAGGTFGPRSLIDNVLTNLAPLPHGHGRGRGAYLLRDEPERSWDHRPFGVVLDLAS